MTRASEHSLSPGRVREIRAEIAQALTEQLKDAHDVVMGKMEWTPTQARVFSIFINKVVPDLHASFVKREDDEDRALNELTRDELERIVAGITRIEAKKSREEEKLHRALVDAEIISEDDVL